MKKKKQTTEYPIKISDWLSFLENETNISFNVFLFIATTIIVVTMMFASLADKTFEMFIGYAAMLVFFVLLIPILNKKSDFVQEIIEDIIEGNITDPEKIRDIWLKDIKPKLRKRKTGMLRSFWKWLWSRITLKKIGWTIVAVLLVIFVPLIGSLAINSIVPLSFEHIASGALGAYYGMCASIALNILKDGKGWRKIGYSLIILTFPVILFLALQKAYPELSTQVFASVAVGVIFVMVLKVAKDIITYKK